MKPFLDGIVVVEGTNDASLITSLVNTEVVVLNGCELQNIKFIKKASENINVYLLTDPDKEGLKIRERMHERISNLIDIEIDINSCTKSVKNGVAECENNEVLLALSKYFVANHSNNSNLKMEMFSKEQRIKICKKLDIELVNNKQLNKRLNILKITKEDVKKLLEE